MKAMALAAGKGTRLFPLTGEIPKPMAPVVNTPIIRHIFALLARHGVTEAHVNVHYLADALLRPFGEESSIGGMQVRLAREKEGTVTAPHGRSLGNEKDDIVLFESCCGQRSGFQRT